MDAQKMLEEEHMLVENDCRVRSDADGALHVFPGSEANNQTSRYFAGELIP